MILVNIFAQYQREYFAQMSQDRRYSDISDLIIILEEGTCRGLWNIANLPVHCTKSSVGPVEHNTWRL